jgi:hypothetical protein
MLCVSLVCAACSRTEPLIEHGFISLVYYQEMGRINERFSFFVIASDDDGMENLDELFLYHDYGQLQWQLKHTDWISYEQDNKTWIGSWSLALNSGESLPRGKFRAVLVNKGGEKTQRNFTFDAPEESRYPFPTLEIDSGYYTVKSLYPENRLICYGSSGEYISTLKLSALTASVSSLSLPSNARSAALWAEDSLYFVSALTEAVSLR